MQTITSENKEQKKESFGTKAKRVAIELLVIISLTSIGGSIVYAHTVKWSSDKEKAIKDQQISQLKQDINDLKAQSSNK